MSSWSTRRKTTYALLTVFTLFVLIVIPLFLWLYKPPTCTDGIRNGDEGGIDCGGSCIKLCQSTFIPLRVTWGGAKFERVSKGLYNLSSYIENNNIYGSAEKVPYKITLYDSSGLMITDKRGSIDIPPHRNVIVFENAVNTRERVPVKATFEFLAPPVWFKSHDVLNNIAIIKKDYKELDNSSFLNVTLENKGLTPYENLTVYSVLYDSENNAIGFSKTVVDEILPKSKQDISFTWPFDRQGRVVSIEVLPSIKSPHDDL